MFVDDTLESSEGTKIFVGSDLQGKLLPGIPTEVEDDWVESVIALNVGSNAGNELTRTKINALLHLVPS